MHTANTLSLQRLVEYNEECYANKQLNEAWQAQQIIAIQQRAEQSEYMTVITTKDNQYAEMADYVRSTEERMQKMQPPQPGEHTGLEDCAAREALQTGHNERQRGGRGRGGGWGRGSTRSRAGGAGRVGRSKKVGCMLAPGTWEEMVVIFICRGGVGRCAG